MKSHTLQKESSPKCPVCGLRVSTRTTIRVVQMWRRVAADDRLEVTIAVCEGCGTEFEVKVRENDPLKQLKKKRRSRLAWALTATLVLSLLNGLLCLMFDVGPDNEWNPVLRFFLSIGPFPFLTAKLLLTSAPLFLLFVYQNYRLLNRRIQAAGLLMAAPLPFGLGVGFQLLLL